MFVVHGVALDLQGVVVMELSGLGGDLVYAFSILAPMIYVRLVINCKLLPSVADLTMLPNVWSFECKKLPGGCRPLTILISLRKKNLR